LRKNGSAFLSFYKEVLFFPTFICKRDAKKQIFSKFFCFFSKKVLHFIKKCIIILSKWGEVGLCEAFFHFLTASGGISPKFDKT
jgi:hypothetical protein